MDLDVPNFVKIFLPLPCPPADWDINATEVTGSCAASVLLKVENAGEKFHDWQMRKLKIWNFPILFEPNSDFDTDVEDTAENDAPLEPQIEEESEEIKKAREKKKAKFLAAKGGKKGNYYALLGLEEKEMDATKEEIKKAYRKISLVAHPDKCLTSDPVEKLEAEENFKRIQEAYEHLSDERKRRIYDSSLEFDDTTPDPEEVTTDEEFFWVYGPCFKRNARFSDEPCPDFGDHTTPSEKVAFI
jgi:hypothetical protein